MKTKRIYINILLLVLFEVTLGRNVLAEAVKPPGEIAYEDRIQFVKTLLEKSSATKQIDASNNPEAIAHRELAISHFERAKQAYSSGSLDEANKELIEASKIMFEAVRMAKKDEITEEKKRRDYQSRLDSVNALMDAHDRVSTEKGKQADGRELKYIVAEKVSNANQLLKEGKLDEARTVLDEAYVAAKIAINSLRGGDTLVRTLKFETKEEEYQYEIDRNNTHKMLLEILKKDNGTTSGMKEMARKYIEKAIELRKQAEQEAASGNHESAIKSLEESTKYLVRALRGSGIYIPG